MPIATATKRWVSCSQIWNAVTSDSAARRSYQALPQSRGPERDDDEHPEEGLSKQSVENSYLVLEHGDAQPSENALQNDRTQRREPEIAHPTAPIRAPNPNRQDDG